MKLFDIFKSKSDNARFISEGAFLSNIRKQMQMTPQTMEQLRKLEVHSDKELRLEYFFYTDTIEKARQLSMAIRQLNYSVDFGPSATNKRLFIVSGCTTKMKMSDEVVGQWTKEMCELGFKFDSEFDGWGTDPYQE